MTRGWATFLAPLVVFLIVALDRKCLFRNWNRTQAVEPPDSTTLGESARFLIIWWVILSLVLVSDERSQLLLHISEHCLPKLICELFSKDAVAHASEEQLLSIFGLEKLSVGFFQRCGRKRNVESCITKARACMSRRRPRIRGLFVMENCSRQQFQKSNSWHRIKSTKFVNEKYKFFGIPMENGDEWKRLMLQSQRLVSFL